MCHRGLGARRTTGTHWATHWALRRRKTTKRLDEETETEIKYLERIRREIERDLVSAEFSLSNPSLSLSLSLARALKNNSISFLFPCSCSRQESHHVDARSSVSGWSRPCAPSSAHPGLASHLMVLLLAQRPGRRPYLQTAVREGVRVGAANVTAFLAAETIAPVGTGERIRESLPRAWWVRGREGVALNTPLLRRAKSGEVPRGI